ncbi:hypothetical protein DRQ50_12900 [bacterium]|nr:MAG: hypothetical protein DRQ50_12900 [bacterium]
MGGYWMDFTDEIVPFGGVNDDGSSIRGNAEKTRHQGIELGMRVQVTTRDAIALAASRSWDEFVSFHQYLDTDWDGTADTEVDNSGNPIALFPEYLGMIAWDRNWHAGVRTRLRGNVTGKQYLDNTGNEERTIDAWGTVDVSLWLALGDLGMTALDGATAFVHARNLGDTEYEVWGYWAGDNWYTPAAGRNLALGLDYDF